MSQDSSRSLPLKYIILVVSDSFLENESAPYLSSSVYNQKGDLITMKWQVAELKAKEWLTHKFAEVPLPEFANPALVEGQPLNSFMEHRLVGFYNTLCSLAPREARPLLKLLCAFQVWLQWG